MFNSRIFRSIVILIVALAFASTAYAMAASNTLADAGKAGDGSNIVSGYDVSGVKYNLDTTNPGTIASVEFDLDTAASNVQASLSDAATPANETFSGTCTTPASGATAGIHWTCPFSSVTAYDAASLRVIAAQ